MQASGPIQIPGNAAPAAASGGLTQAGLAAIHAGLGLFLLAAARLSGGGALVYPAIGAGCLAAWATAAFLLMRTHRLARGLSGVALETARGRLDAVAPASGRGPLGDAARAMDELSANLQEVLLLLWNQNTASLNLLTGAAGSLRDGGGTGPALADLAKAAEGLRAARETVEIFSFFDVRVQPGSGLFAGTEKRDP